MQAHIERKTVMDENKKRAVLVSLGSIERLKLVKTVIEEKYETTMVCCDFSHNTKTYVKRDIECMYIHVPSYRKNLSFARIYSLLYYSTRVYKFVKKKKPDLLYVILPPNKIAAYCSKYKKNYKNTKLLFDIYDLWPESMPMIGFERTLPGRIWGGAKRQKFGECRLYFL